MYMCISWSHHLNVSRLTTLSLPFQVMFYPATWAHNISSYIIKWAHNISSYTISKLLHFLENNFKHHSKQNTFPTFTSFPHPMVSPWNKQIKAPQKNPLFLRSHSHLVCGIPTPLKNMTSSVGTIPNIWENKHVPKHQPVIVAFPASSKMMTL